MASLFSNVSGGDIHWIFPQGFETFVLDWINRLSLYAKGFWPFLRFTLQPEIIAKLIPKTLFHVTEMRFSKKIISKKCSM